MHVRAGAILPTGPVKQYVDEPVDGPLSLTIYPGADGAFTLYEDDGRSFAYRRGDFMKIALAWNDRTRRLSLSLEPGARLRPPMPRVIEVRVAGSTATRRVEFAGTPVGVQL
jgi:alpha-glucosidase (family GH31 glycosyl hydrolase)